MQQKEFEIWCEGYIATGEHQPASLIGKGVGETFDDAVRDYMAKNPDHTIEPVTREMCDSDAAYLDRRSSWRIYGCALFDNEADARRFAG